MAEAPDIAPPLAIAPGQAPWSAAPTGAALPERCPRCGGGRLRFDRDIPCGTTIRRYDRCTAPGCDFEAMRLVRDLVTTPGATAGAP
ncbi:MAG TPA: hypothetical protein VGM87_02210 [Roseomonas sp.]|jgi:hypothetical protein